MATAYSLFRNQGLRHLPVVDSTTYRLAGILTRKDFIEDDSSAVAVECGEKLSSAIQRSTSRRYNTSPIQSSLDEEALAAFVA